MQSKALTPEAYIESLPEDRKMAISILRQLILKHLPPGFEEVMSYGMLGYVVPHAIYPSGYHCDPKLPLPFLNLASQKNNITLYHMGLYGGAHLEWFKEQWQLRAPKKLDMGKSCIRFKKLEDAPLDLLGELCSKITPAQWIEIYEKHIKR